MIDRTLSVSAKSGENPTGLALTRIGTPCLIEADVPISTLRAVSYLSAVVGRRYLLARGLDALEGVNHADRATAPVPPERIRQILLYSDNEFDRLTGCSSWSPPL